MVDFGLCLGLKLAAVRVVVYDMTCGWLTLIWRIGAWLLTRAGRYDRIVAARSWDGTLAALSVIPVLRRVEFWGHGAPGAVLLRGARLVPVMLESLRARMTLDGLVWFRTCSAFADVSYAEALARAVGVRVAGHVGWIGPKQAGLVVVDPDGARSEPVDVWAWSRGPA